MEIVSSVVLKFKFELILKTLEHSNDFHWKSCSERKDAITTKYLGYVLINYGWACSKPYQPMKWWSAKANLTDTFMHLGYVLMNHVNDWACSNPYQPMKFG